MMNNKIILSLILTLTVTLVFAEGQYGMEEFYNRMALISISTYTIIIGILIIILKRLISRKISLKTVILSFSYPLAVFTILYFLIDTIFFVLPYILIKGLFE